MEERMDIDIEIQFPNSKGVYAVQATTFSEKTKILMI